MGKLLNRMPVSHDVAHDDKRNGQIAYQPSSIASIKNRSCREDAVLTMQRNRQSKTVQRLKRACRCVFQRPCWKR
jgi:hypothetical protein